MKLHGKIFVPVPGNDDYYWCILTQTLFSAKKTNGVPLKELRVLHANKYNDFKAGYQMFNKRLKNYATVNWLKTLNHGDAIALVFDENTFDEDLFEI
jgi:hypothetical protein